MLVVAATALVLAQRPSPAEGPWAGQAQCTLVAKGADYEEEQTHTWTLTGASPTPEGAFQNWPATWRVQGTGRRQIASPPASERWTISGEMNAPLSIWELAGGSGRLRVGARHGQLSAPSGSIKVTPSAGREMDAAQQEWQFPVIEDAATSPTLSGTSTRTFPAGFTFGWRQPRSVTTIETCTWRFVRGGAPGEVVPSTAAGTPVTPDLVTGRGRGTFSSTTAPVPPRSIAMTGFAARGEAVTVPPRAITLNGFTATGSGASVSPRSIALTGFAGHGDAAAMPPRAITVTGWTAVGANATAPRGRDE